MCLYNHRESALLKTGLKIVFANAITSWNFEENSFKMDTNKKEIQLYAPAYISLEYFLKYIYDYSTFKASSF